MFANVVNNHIYSFNMYLHPLKAGSLIVMVSEGEQSWLTGHISISENKWSWNLPEHLAIMVFTLKFAAAAAAESLQLCPTLCDPIDGSPPGSPVPGILQAETLEWVAISISNAWKWKVKVKSLSHVWLLATPWTAAYQAPLPMGFSRQEYWSGVPLC